MADAFLYLFFHLSPLIAVLMLPMALVIRPVQWLFDRIEDKLEKINSR